MTPAFLFLCFAVLILAIAAINSLAGLAAFVCVVVAFLLAEFGQRMPALFMHSDAFMWVLLLLLAVVVVYVVMTRVKPRPPQ